jgi:hypothetical protein
MVFGSRAIAGPAIILVAIASAALSTIQTTTQTVPTWSIQFVDQLGRPFVGLRVVQSWQNYSLENDRNFAIETTDESGVAVFPARYIQASKLKRILGPLESFLFRGLVHASYGAHSSVLPKCNLRLLGPELPFLLDGHVPSKVILGSEPDRIILESESGVSRAECARVEAQAIEADRLVEASS